MANQLMQEYLDRAHAAEQLVLKLRMEETANRGEQERTTAEFERAREGCWIIEASRLDAVHTARAAQAELAAAKAKIAELEETIQDLRSQIPQESVVETAASPRSLSYTLLNTGTRVVANGSNIPPGASSVRSEESPKPSRARIARSGEIQWRGRETAKTRRLERRALERRQEWLCEDLPQSQKQGGPRGKKWEEVRSDAGWQG
ncbi:hypothetical protein LTR27_011379 [Elasticomyces elasticus]|nr:hypothetical protein LTR27_011379 [Elasticomyces elasticus]